MAVETEPAPSLAILWQITTDLDPFEHMAMATVAAKHLRSARGEGAPTRQCRHCLYFGLCENDKAGAKVEPI